MSKLLTCAKGVARTADQTHALQDIALNESDVTEA